MYQKLDDVEIFGIRTDCILFKGETRVEFDFKIDLDTQKNSINGWWIQA